MTPSPSACPAVERAAAARDNGQAFFAGHLDDDGYVVRALGANDASGETLIHGRISGVAPPREEVACGVAFDLMRKPVPERRSGPSNRHFPSMRQSSSARLTQTVLPRRQTMAQSALWRNGFFNHVDPRRRNRG